MITAAKKQYIEACLRQSMKQSKITYEVVEDGEEFVIHCQEQSQVGDNYIVDAMKAADCVLVEFEYREIILMLTDCDD